MKTYEEFNAEQSRLRTELQRLCEGMESELQTDPYLDEGVGVSLLLAAPVVIEWSGRLLRAIGMKLVGDPHSVLVKVGNILDSYGRGLQSRLLETIRIALKPFIFWLPRSKQDTAAKAAFLAILVGRLAMGAPDLVSLEANLVSATEKVLAALDVRELILGVKGVGSQLMATA